MCTQPSLPSWAKLGREDAKGRQESAQGWKLGRVQVTSDTRNREVGLTIMPRQQESQLISFYAAWLDSQHIGAFSLNGSL